MSESSWWASRVAVVTGASRGIGAATAEELARRGASVALLSRDGDRLDRVAGGIQADGGRALPIVCDVANSTDVESAIRTVLDAHPGIDILVNNAGIDDPAPLWDLSDEQWDRVIGINLSGAFYCTRAVVRSSMRESGGAIVNVASHSGIRGSRGRANYSASKAGLIGLTKACALELGEFGIRANAVAPGAVITDMTEKLRADPELSHRFLAEMPLARFGEAQDVASLIAFLAGPESTWITGKVIGVDGGAITA